MNKRLRHKLFSHIYVEENVFDHVRTRQILSHFPNAEIILIHDYREVFNRTKQNIVLQQESRSLILAEKKDGFVYQSSPVCQAFDEEYFYYCGCVMNCIYDCEYCFLKGMYPSANIVVFVNLEDIFHEVDELLQKHSVYLCVSFDTDMLALENILGYGAQWAAFAKKRENLTIEIRTKGAPLSAILSLPVCERIILAFTLSPDVIASQYEHGTYGFSQRLNLISAALEYGHTVRLCFDPILPVPHYQEHYRHMVEETAERIDLHQVRDISIGTFRLSREYMKTMRTANPYSMILQYPYECINGFYQLPEPKKQEIEGFMEELLLQKTEKEKIFLWKE